MCLNDRVIAKYSWL